MIMFIPQAGHGGRSGQSLSFNRITGVLLWVETPAKATCSPSIEPDR
jgi:hypothetical protein